MEEQLHLLQELKQQILIFTLLFSLEMATAQESVVIILFMQQEEMPILQLFA